MIVNVVPIRDMLTAHVSMIQEPSNQRISITIPTTNTTTQLTIAESVIERRKESVWGEKEMKQTYLNQ